MTVISSVNSLPASKFDNTGIVGVLITSGFPSYFKVSGVNLDQIVSVNWYPKKPGSVDFSVRPLVLVDSTEGTFMIRVEDNHLDDRDRGGHISFALADGTTIPFSVKTYGPVHAGRLWTSPREGLNTG